MKVELKGWLQDIEWKARYKTMSSRVLIVAVINETWKEWSCFVDAVLSEKHDEEWKGVAEHGSSVPFEVAKIYFSDYADKYLYVHGW